MKLNLFVFLALLVLCCTTVFAASSHKRAEQQVLDANDVDIDTDVDVDVVSDSSVESSNSIATVTESEIESDTLAAATAELEHLSEVDAAGVSVNVARINQQTYCHGACMGAASAMLNDPLWSAIYQKVLPDQYTASKQLLSGAIDKLQLNMENNPILAAYGSVQHILRADPNNKQANPGTVKGGLLRHEWDLWLDATTPGDVTKAKLAHGEKWTTIAQAIFSGFDMGSKFQDVKNAPSPVTWLTSFGRAIELYRASATKGSFASTAALAPAQQAIATAAPFFASSGGVYLDIKSTYANNAGLNAFITNLQKEYKVIVLGVGTFTHKQLPGLMSPVKAVRFYHTHVGVLADKKNLKRGDIVMFNAGSFLDNNNKFLPAEFQTFANLQKQLALNVAVYVQEPATSVAALQEIVQLVNSQSTVINLGFAYGNVNGLADPKPVGNGLGIQAPMLTKDKLAYKIFG